MEREKEKEPAGLETPPKPAVYSDSDVTSGSILHIAGPELKTGPFPAAWPFLPTQPAPAAPSPGKSSGNTSITLLSGGGSEIGSTIASKDTMGTTGTDYTAMTVSSLSLHTVHFPEPGPQA